MSASGNFRDGEENNIHILKPARLAQTDQAPDHKRLPCDIAEAYAVPGTFSDKNTQQIAKRMCEHINLNYNLCCQLEHIADGLPDNVDRQECLYVARSIIPVVKLAHEFEENTLFPLLRDRSLDRPQLDKTLDRLQGEHWEDESYAAEIHNGLISYVSGVGEKNTDSLGYMLRGFFEGMRRHLAFEREHVLPLLKELDGAR